MAELKEQQIEFAVAAFENVAGHAATGELLSMAERMRRAAPFLQLPWDEPSVEEFRPCWEYAKHLSLYANHISLINEAIESALCEFVRRRNAALQPKPVDPRIAVILGVLDSSACTSDVKAKEITAALDALDGAK